MDADIRKQFRLVQLYEELGNARVVCFTCGISRPTPIERLTELTDKTLLWEEVGDKFDPAKERIQEQNYRAELELRRLKRCL